MPRTLYKGSDLLVQEHIPGPPLTVADFVGDDMSFRADAADELFDRLIPADAPPPPSSTTTRAEWEHRVRRALRIGEAQIASLGQGFGLLELPQLFKTFPQRPPAADHDQAIRLHAAAALGNLMRAPDGELSLSGWEFAESGPLEWTYATLVVRNPWPPEVRLQVHDWCIRRIKRLHGNAALENFTRYLALEARIAAIEQAFQSPEARSDSAVRPTDLLHAFRENLEIVRGSALLDRMLDLTFQRLLDRFADLSADGWLPEPGRLELAPRLDEPRAPSLTISVRELLENPEIGRHRLGGLNSSQLWHSWPHRLEVTSAHYESVDSDDAVVARLRMRAVVMVGRTEFGDVEVRFDLDAAGTVTAYVDPGPAIGFVPDYLRARGGTDRGSFLDMVRHFARGVGTDVLRMRIADDKPRDHLRDRNQLVRAGLTPTADSAQWLSEQCQAVPAAAAPVASQLNRRLTQDQVLQIMDRVRVSQPDEYENQCGVWHLPVSPGTGSAAGPMVTVRAYLPDARRLNFDLDQLAASAPEASNRFHEAGVHGPRLLFDSESSGQPYPTQVTIHQFVPGDEVLPEEGWERTTEDIFPELYRLHTMQRDYSYMSTSQSYWDATQKRRIRELEHNDVDHRLDALTGGVPLFATWMAVDDGPTTGSPMGFTHGNPIRRKMRRGADGRIGFTDAKSAQFAPIAWDWARYYLGNEWLDDAGRDAAGRWIKTMLEEHFGPGAVTDFDRYVVLEARKSISGDAYRMPKKIAAGLVSVEDVLPAFYRNIVRVCKAADPDREPPFDEQDVGHLLEEWAERELESHMPGASPAATPAAEVRAVPAAVAPQSDWVKRLFTYFRRSGTHVGPEEIQATLALRQRWDGPARLEPVQAWFEVPSEPSTGVVARMRVLTVVMDGTREYDDAEIVFELHDSGRISAICYQADAFTPIDRLALDFVRDAGADQLRLEVTDGPGAARAGFGWDEEHLDEIREAIDTELSALERRDSPAPASVTELRRRLREGDVPTPRELLDGGVDLDDITAHLSTNPSFWWGRIEVATASDAGGAVWSNLGLPQVEQTDVAPPAPTSLPVDIESEGSGILDPRAVARLALRAALRSPDWQGSKLTWFDRDDRGNRVVVSRQLPSTTAAKDLTRNPRRADRVYRWFRRLPFDAADAERLAAGAVEVPTELYEWDPYRVQRFVDGRTPAPTDSDWEAVLDKMFALKRRLLELPLPAHLQQRTVTEHFHLYLDFQRRNYRDRAEWLDSLFRLAPHQAWSPDTYDQAWPPSLNHNDMTLDNVRIADDGTATLIDWDNTAITHPLWDYVTILWSPWAPDRAEAVENKIRSEVRSLFGARGEAELDRLLTMACLDSLYADSQNFVDQIARDPDKTETLVGRFYSDYRRLCRLRGWEPERLEVVRSEMRHAANLRRVTWGSEPLPEATPAVPRPVLHSVTDSPESVLPPAELPGDDELLAVVTDLLHQQYGPRGYTVIPTSARYTEDTANRRLTVSATIIDGAQDVNEPGDMRFHVHRNEDGLVTVTFDHLFINEPFRGSRFAEHFVPRLRSRVGAGGRIIVPIHGRAGFRIAAVHGLQLDPDPDHLAESRESTVRLLDAHGLQVVADPMLDRFDRPAEARPTFAEMARYFEQSTDGWPDDRRWWGVLEVAADEATPDTLRAETSPTAPRRKPRAAGEDTDAGDPALTEPQIEFFTTMVRNRAWFVGNHHGVWVITMPNGRKVVIRVPTDTPNPNFDPRIGLVFGEPLAVALSLKAGVRVPKLLHVGARDAYPESFLIHEHLDGDHPTPDEPWQPIAEALFTELDRMHALHPDEWDDTEHGQTLPTTRAEWERRLAREVARIRLEYDSKDSKYTEGSTDRLHGELGMPGLHEVFSVRPESPDDVRLGAVHGDPTFGNVLRTGPDGEEIALLDLELSQPGSPVWDYVAFAARNPWPTPAVRGEVENWCRQRLRTFYGEKAAADFDRYLVLEAWKSAAGDSFRLPLRVASGQMSLENAAEALYRNLTRVFAAVGRPGPELPEVRAHIERWVRRFAQRRDREQALAGPPTHAASATETSVLPRMSIRGLLRADVGNAEADADLLVAIAAMYCGDGPARLEPVEAQYELLDEADGDIVRRIRMRTVLMDGPREYGDVWVVFELDRAGRVTARPEPTAELDRLASEYGGPYLLGPAEDLARRMGADALTINVSDKEGMQAAQRGFGWDTEPGRLAESMASLSAAMQSQAPGGSLSPADEPQPLLETPLEVSRRTGPGVLRATRWWASKDVADAPPARIEYRTATRRPRGEEYLPDVTEAVGDGGLQPEKVVELAVTTAMEPPHARGHYTHVWCVTDRDGKIWKVRLIAAEPGDKDLAANPTHPKLLDGDRPFHRIKLTENRAEDMARQAGVAVPETVAQWGAGSTSRGASSIRHMGDGRIPTTGDEYRFDTLRGLLRQLRRLQAVELPDDLAARTVAEHEQLYRSMQRIKYEQRHRFLNAMRIPMPNEISVPGDTDWAAGLSHGNATFRNLWLRPDGEVALDNWNLTSVRHKLWDYVTVFWAPWELEDLDQVTAMVEDDIRDQYGEPGVDEFRRLRAMACLDSLYSDSNTFVQKIRIDQRQAETLTKRFYSDYLTLWKYAEAAGLWPSRGSQALTYEQVDELMRHAALETDLDAPGDSWSVPQARATPDPDLSAVLSIPDLLAEHLAEHELLPRLSGLQQQFKSGIGLVLNRVEYLRTGPGQFVSGVRIRGAFVIQHENPAEVGDLDLSIEWDENGRLIARFDNLWIEPWHDRTGCSRDVVPALLDYLRRSGVEQVSVTVHGRRGAAAAIHHGLDWDYSDPRRLGECMGALSQRIRAHLTMTPNPEVTPGLRQLLGELEYPTDGKYPTPADIAHHLPPGLNAANFFDEFHWQGVTVP
ncbi:hypothetical protein AB0M12_43945 [Nocardia vinacea]|uniref:hypothetical protein n=1 Tax=Nocardia vinacea TaxID=96468 RepID=UPI003418614E